MLSHRVSILGLAGVFLLGGTIGLRAASLHQTPQEPPRPVPKPRPILPPRPMPMPRPIPLPPPRATGVVVIKSVTVNAVVRDGVAETEVSHIFENRTDAVQEGDFVFPIPAGANVSSFALYDGEKKMDAQLLDKDQATQTYEEIVRRRRDPALLTFQGREALRARLYPIAPHSERRITLKLVTILPREGDARKYAWTLAGPQFSASQKPEFVSVRVEVNGAQPVGNVYSPTYEVGLRRDSESKIVATWTSDKNNGATLAENPEFALYITPKSGTGGVALSALTFSPVSQVASATGVGAARTGYFLVVASPTLTEAARANIAPRRVVLVMDRSGSMQGKKIEQAKSALRFALGKLRPQDRFNILTFSDNVEMFSPNALTATPENRRKAEAFVDDISADGGTNIGDALKGGLNQFPEKASGNTLLFFTDGLPTVGERSQPAIVKNAVAANGNKTRAFVFGVGYDVDVPFLDTVAKSLRGDADYVRPDEDIEVKTSRFVAKTSSPVLENLKININGAQVSEMYPRPADLPDLFLGSQLVLTGRYKPGDYGDTVNITLTGEANNVPQTYTLAAKWSPANTSSDFLPRLWAGRKIGYLLDDLRLREDPTVRKEITEQIIALSKEYGVLTPFTALFVPEPGDGPVALQDNLNLMVRGNHRQGASTRGVIDQNGFRVDSASDSLSAYAPAPASAAGGFGGGAGAGSGRQGEAAVNASQSARAYRSQSVVGNAQSINSKAGAEQEQDAKLARRIQNVANRTFYQTGTQWTDAGFDPAKQKDVVKIKLYSPAYFALTRRNANLARWAALGENVVIAANATQAVQFGKEGRDTLTETELVGLVGR